MSNGIKLLNIAGRSVKFDPTGGCASLRVAARRIEGSAWKDGKHYLFEKNTITVTQGWPGLRVWICNRDGVWKGSPSTPVARALWYAERLVADASYLEKKRDEKRKRGDKSLATEDFAMSECEEALLSLLTTIPQNVLERVNRFSTDGAWHLLRLQSWVRGADELIDSNPALGWMLANHWIFRNGVGKSDATRIARRWVGKPQSDILQWLGFDGSESTRRIVARVDPRAAEALPLLYLRSGLQDAEARKAMQHLPALTRDSMHIVTNPKLACRVTPNFLKEVAEQTSWGFFTSPIASGLKKALLLESEGKLKLPKRFHSIEQLNAPRLFHLSSPLLFERAYSYDYIQNTVFPAAPYPSVPGIEPIIDYDALETEGKDLQHCIAAYASEILLGSCYIYKVTQPIRATLEARRVPCGWTLGEIKGKRNEEIEMKHAIFIWKMLTAGRF